LKVKAIVGGVLIDGTGGEPIEDPVVVIEDGMIKAVGSRGEVKVPSGADVRARLQGGETGGRRRKTTL